MSADSCFDKPINPGPRIVWKLDVFVLLDELTPQFAEPTASLRFW